MKRIHNRLAILLIFALLLSLAAPVGAAGSRITIRTPEDLVELSRRCSLDSWSRGKQSFYLRTLISLMWNSLPSPPLAAHSMGRDTPSPGLL